MQFRSHNLQWTSLKYSKHKQFKPQDTLLKKKKRKTCQTHYKRDVAEPPDCNLNSE